MFAPDLADARASLTYWEERCRRLPRHAVRKRREAREMAARWRARVAEAERAAYGAGVLATALFVLTERRLPADTRHGARRLARRGAQAAALVALACVSVMVLALAAVAHLVASVL